MVVTNGNSGRLEKSSEIAVLVASATESGIGSNAEHALCRHFLYLAAPPAHHPHQYPRAQRLTADQVTLFHPAEYGTRTAATNNMWKKIGTKR